MLELLGEGSQGVSGELGVSDLNGLSSKTPSWSIKLVAESLDLVDTFECRLGRGEGVFEIGRAHV